MQTANLASFVVCRCLFASNLPKNTDIPTGAADSLIGAKGGTPV